MRRLKRLTLIAAVCAYALAAGTALSQDARTAASVTHIVHGDTIDVVPLGMTATVRVRYIGMNTPERGAPFFHESTGRRTSAMRSSGRGPALTATHRSCGV